MIRTVMNLVTIFIVALAVTAGSVRAAEIDKNLMIFKDLIGKQWEGHFEDANEPMTLYMSWEQVIDGAAIQMNGWSNSSDMKRLNIYYFDRAKNQVAFLAMTSNGYISTGTVQSEDSALVFLGQQTGPDGKVRDMKSRWEFMPDGTMRNIGYRLENSEWLPGHKIVYKAADSK